MTKTRLQAMIATAWMFAVGAAQAEDGLARVQDVLDETSSLSANFSQTLLDPEGKG